MFWIFSPVAASAGKALSLRNDTVFRLLVVMTALLGWLAGLGGSGLVGLQNVYGGWQLEQKTRVSVYLLADSEPQALDAMAADLSALPGVRHVERLNDKAVQDLLHPYFTENSHFPLPVVVDVAVDDRLDRAAFDAKVKGHFSTAEIDDARVMMTDIGRGVRWAQALALAVAGAVLVVMALLVSLTVRAGLRGQRKSLAILQYVGSTDSFVVRLVVRQVLERSLMGFLAAAALICLSLGTLLKGWAAASPYLSWSVLGVGLLIPFLLVVVAVAVAQLTALKVVKEVEAS